MGNIFKQIALIGLLGFTAFHIDKPLDYESINIEPPILIPSENMPRYLAYHKVTDNYRPQRNIQEFYAMERLLPSILNELCPEVKKYMCISTKYLLNLGIHRIIHY